MKRAARILIALGVAAFAVPVLACGFEKGSPTTTTTMSAPAPAGAVARAEKAKRVKAQKTEKAKAPADQKVATTN